MSSLAQIPENTLTVDVAAIPTIFVSNIRRIVVRHRNGKVFLFVDHCGVELSTITAHGIGMAIARGLSQLEPGEMIVITINGEKIELLRPYAEKVYAGLLRKADDADDWQLANKRVRTLQ